MCGVVCLRGSGCSAAPSGLGDGVGNLLAADAQVVRVLVERCELVVNAVAKAVVVVWRPSGCCGDSWTWFFSSLVKSLLV